MGNALLKLRLWWETADRATKTVTLVGGTLLAALLAVVYYFSTTPDMRQLFPPLDPAEQGRVIQKLQELKVPYRQDPDGSLFVPGNKVAEIRARLAQQGLPASGALGNLRLDHASFTDSASLQDQKFRVALEEELQKSLMMMAPIANAKVHIAPGDDSPFISSKREPSASVVLQIRPGSSAREEVGQAVVATLVGAVAGLKPQNIFVSDNNGQVLWDGSSQTDGGIGPGLKKRQAEVEEAARLERRIESALLQILGPNKAIVSAEVEINFDREDVITETEIPSKQPIAREVVSEGYGPGVSTLSGEGAPGTVTTPTSSNTERAYANRAERANYATTRERSEKTKATGTVTARRVSILLDKTVEDRAREVETFVANLIGANTNPERFQVAVSVIPFDQTLSEQAQKELAAARSAQMKQQIFSLLPIIALIIVGFLVVKALAKAASQNTNITITTKAFAPSTAASLAPPQGGSPHVPAPLPASAQTSEEELSDTARKRVEAIKRAMWKDVEDIPEKFDRELAQILKMADTRPEAVALLIKSWLLEETL
ncbi:MAG: flagellar M-ring protein FliF [Fimbriimonadales bacterium]|nr:flagellar M-ring protein FliF [Fimbriimonadales bacterium]